MSTIDNGRNGSLEADARAVAELRDREAFHRLFDHYAPRVKSYLRRLGAGEDVAEDLMQEVMLTIWRRAEQFDPAQGRAEHLDLHYRPQQADRCDPARAAPGFRCSRTR